MKRWIDHLEEEDLAFLKRFVLSSGSLKELAQAYGISYPTVRLRLDRLIEKIRVFESMQPMSDFERTLRGLHADGTLDLATFKKLLKSHQQTLEENHESKPDAAGSDGVGKRK